MEVDATTLSAFQRHVTIFVHLSVSLRCCCFVMSFDLNDRLAPDLLPSRSFRLGYFSSPFVANVDVFQGCGVMRTVMWLLDGAFPVEAVAVRAERSRVVMWVDGVAVD